MDPVQDPLLLRKSGSAGNRIWDLCICSQKLWPLDQRGGRNNHYNELIKQKKISSLKWIWKQNSIPECIQLINCMDQNYYWKSTSRTASHKILHLLLNPTVRTRGCITTCPSSVFCTSSSTQLFSVSKILLLRERKFDHVITINYTCQVQTQDFHRCFQKCPLLLDLVTQVTWEGAAWKTDYIC